MRFTERMKVFFIRRKVKKIIKEKKTSETIQGIKIDSIQHDLILVNRKLDAIMRLLKERVLKDG